MRKEKFRELVKQAILLLPEHIRQKMDNVGIVIEDSPSEYQLQKTGVRNKGYLLGLYEGIPKTTWGKGLSSHLPDKITIFQESIEKFASSEEDIKNLVQKVVWHEIAHHFGFDEKEVRDFEAKHF